MAIDFDSGTGLFDRLGRIGYVYQVVSDFFAGASANQLEKEVNDILAEYDGASNIVRSAVEGVLESKTRFQLDPERFLLDLQGAAESTLIEMAHADNPLQEKTLERALAELIRQMKAANKTVDANEPSATITASAGNDGTLAIVCSLTGPQGQRLEYVFPEDITLTCTVASGQTGTLEAYGETSAAPSGQSVFWPDGSSAATSFNVIDPSLDGFLVNGDFESWAAGAIVTWTPVVGTFNEETTIKQFGAKCASLKGFVILNFAAVSGICAITASGMCPFNLSNLKLDLVVTASVICGFTGVAAEASNILFQVPSPTIPSAVKPFLACQSLTAFSVPAPKMPSAPSPNFVWSFLTSSPWDPTFSNIVQGFYFYISLKSHQIYK